MDFSSLKICEKFKCLEGNCPVVCCRGWLVPVDDCTLKKYHDTPSLKGMWLIMNCQNNEYAGPSLRRINRRCIHLGLDGLCRFQKAGCPDLMPQICKSFPKSVVNYGRDYQELSLDLSCYQAAILFIKYINAPDDYEYSITISDNDFSEYSSVNEAVVSELDNDDDLFLKLLFSHRNEFIKAVFEKDFASVVNSVNSFVYNIYEDILVADLSEDNSADKALEQNKSFGKYQSVFEKKFEVQESDLSLAFFPIATLNTILYGWFSEKGRKKENPYITGIVEKYKKEYGSLLENEADDYFNRKIKSQLKKHEDWMDIFKKYYAYILSTTYCKAYDDYYMMRSPWLAAVFTQYLMLFFSVSGADNEKEYAVLISNFEKAMRHNASLEELLISKIRKCVEGKILNNRGD